MDMPKHEEIIFEETVPEESAYIDAEEEEEEDLIQVDAEVQRLRLHKIQLEVYKLKLEALKLERELELPRSHYTGDIPDPVNDNVVDVGDHA